MKRRNLYLFIATALVPLSLLACGDKNDNGPRTDEFQLQTGDLLFQVGRDGGMNDAIAQATGDELDFDYTHVGIAIVGPDGPQVIEATGGVGVVITTLDEFLSRSAMSADGPVVTVARLISARREQISLQAIERAKTFMGQPYDTSFLPNNGKIYCSELVWESFQDDGTAIFDAQPMNFRAPDGTMPPYWIAHFEALGEPIPEGVPGTNPHDMSHDEDIKIIHRY